jgi:transposase
MDQVHVIRDKVLREGKSVRQAARELGISRVTARKYVQGDAEPPRRKPPVRQRPKLERVAARMAALVEDWSARTTAKQHITATRLHQALLDEQFDVGITTVRVWLAEEKRKQREVFVPLQHYAGQEAQVDFFEVTVDIAGERRKAWMFVMRLMHSGRDFAWLYWQCDQVSFLDGHVRAFAHFGGVPHRLIYDNLKAAVRKILHVGRELSGRFEALAAHYVFEPSFARPYTGHDKGGVESRGRGVRLQHLVLECFSEDEQPRLLPVLRGAFDPRKLESVDADRSSRVRVAGARYSVPSGWALCEIEARVGVEEIELRCRGEAVTVPRQPKGGQHVDYRHYLPELRKKPQAVRQVMPALLEQFGEPFGRLWRLLVDMHGPPDAARVFARVLGAVVEHGEVAVRASVDAALARDRIDLVLLLPLRPEERATPVHVPAALAHHHVEARRAAEYDVLLGENDHE